MYLTVSKYTIITPDLLEDGFESSPPWFFGLIAERAGRVVGHALCNRAYSSWTRRAFYLEDLYVRPEARRAGVALRLLEELCKVRDSYDYVCTLSICRVGKVHKAYRYTRFY